MLSTSFTPGGRGAPTVDEFVEGERRGRVAGGVAEVLVLGGGERGGGGGGGGREKGDGRAYVNGRRGC